MSLSWDDLWSFKTRRFTVTLSVAPEPEPDWSWCDEETLGQLNSGALGDFLFRVTVSLDGRTIGEDYLGGSVYVNPEGFREENIGHRSYFGDMVREAIGEARATVSRFHQVALQA